MKRIFGLSLVIIFGSINLLYLFFLLYIVIADTQENSLETVLTFVFVIALFSFPVAYGYRIWKRERRRDHEANEEYHYSTVKFESKIQFEEYRKLAFGLQYRTPVFLFTTFIGLNLILWTFLGDEPNLFGTFLGAAMLIPPLLIPVFASHTYHKGTNYHEKLQCEINVDTITIKGETFNTNDRWANIPRMIELNKWFVIYASRYIPRFFLSKKNMTARDIEIVRYFLTIK